MFAGFAPNESEDSRDVPVIMYHSVCNTNVCEYVVSPRSLREDFAYLAARGYTAVFMSDVIDFCDGKRDLPPKPVVLTFDDGFYNNYYYALKIAAEYGMKIVVSVVGSYSAKEEGESKRSPVYSYLSSAEIKAMYDSGRVEICNHTYDMHRTHPRKGVRKLSGESAEDYERKLTEDSEKCRNLIKSACGCSVNVFTYPFGCYSKETGDILARLGYRAMLTCKGGINKFTRGKSDGLDSVMRYNRSGNLTTARFFASIKV